MSRQLVRLEVTVQAGMLVVDKKHAKRVLRAAGNEVAARARRLVSGAGGSGRIYYGTGGGSAAREKGGYRKFRWAASLPGQPPAKVTGSVAQSFKVRVFRDGQGVSIRNLMFYAKMLETGAEGGGRTWSHTKLGRRYARGKKNIGSKRVLRPRPFLSVALAAVEGTLAQRIGTALVQGTKFVRQPLPRKP